MCQGARPFPDGGTVLGTGRRPTAGDLGMGLGLRYLAFTASSVCESTVSGCSGCGSIKPPRDSGRKLDLTVRYRKGRISLGGTGTLGGPTPGGGKRQQETGSWNAEAML